MAEEQSHKVTAKEDKAKLRWLDEHSAARNSTPSTAP